MRSSQRRSSIIRLILPPRRTSNETPASLAACTAFPSLQVSRPTSPGDDKTRSAVMASRPEQQSNGADGAERG